VHVLTQLETLLGDNEHPAETTRGQFLPAQVARDLAAQGTLRRVLVDEHGRLVAVEAHTDRPNPELPVPPVTPLDTEPVDTEPVLLSAEFHHHQRSQQRRDRRHGTDPPAEDRPDDP
jgi:hypothetical protein